MRTVTSDPVASESIVTVTFIAAGCVGTAGVIMT